MKINKSCYDYKSQRVITTTKTYNSTRVIPLSKKLLKIISKLKNQSKCDFIVNEKDKPLTIQSYQRTFELLLKKLKIEHKGFHTLRHTFATRAIECGVDVKTPSEDVKNLFDKLKKMGFKIIIFTNSRSKRAKPFKNILGVDCCPFACKPFSKKFLSIIKVYDLKFSEVAIIGDSMMDDIYGGNKVGITTILIDQLAPKEFIIASLKRKRERKIIKKLRDNNLFSKESYYE